MEVASAAAHRGMVGCATPLDTGKSRLLLLYAANESTTCTTKMQQRRGGRSGRKIEAFGL